MVLVSLEYSTMRWKNYQMRDFTDANNVRLTHIHRYLRFSLE